MTKQIVWVLATGALLSRGGSPDITGDWNVVATFDRAHRHGPAAARPLSRTRGSTLSG
jgi:hypothetical protein